MKQTILIVDDEPHIVVPVKFLLAKNGFEVITAASGEEALEKISGRPPDLILLDIMLPGIDGYEICEMIRLKPEHRNVKLVFMTAKGRDVDVTKGLMLGADAYIIKPFTNADLVAKVKSLLNGHGPTRPQ